MWVGSRKGREEGGRAFICTSYTVHVLRHPYCFQVKKDLFGAILMIFYGDKDPWLDTSGSSKKSHIRISTSEQRWAQNR
jgi:hypothetical protein